MFFGSTSLQNSGWFRILRGDAPEDCVNDNENWLANMQEWKTEGDLKDKKYKIPNEDKQNRNMNRG